MSIRAGLLVICAAVFLLIAGSLYVVSRALDTQSDIAQAEVPRYHSYKLADELRQSSDDLTRMARLYVVTGDTRYRMYFEQIIAIRDGKAPRPLDYGNVYWDFVVAWGKPARPDDRAIALEQLMHDAHFSDDELAYLRQAKSRSDALVALESRAMHAVQGRFPDDRGQFTRTGPPDMEFARRLMNGPEYHRAKAEIMTPIHEFLGRVESRTAAEVTRLRRRGERLHFVAIAGLGTAVILVLVSFALLARPRWITFSRGAVPPPGGAAMPRGRGRTPGQALWTTWPLLAAAAAACASVVMLAWWLSENIEERVRGDIRDALETVHQTTARSVDDWLTQIAHEVGAWARSPQVRNVVTPPGPGRMGGELLTPLNSLPSFAGYLILDPAGRIVTSDERGLLTRKVTRELGEGLRLAVDQSPDHAIVVFSDGREPGEEVTSSRDIVVVATVRDDRDREAGLLLLRFDPRLDLSRILDRGRLGESGQSYAFDRTGRPLVESRFWRPVGPEGQTLSTQMARAALAGRSGLDVDGYRDYRGVPVIGAWTWNEHYGIGIATEVGLDEAYGALAGFQRQTRLGTGLAVLLIVALSGLFAWNRLAMAAASAKLEGAYAIIRGHKERMEEELRVGRDLQLSMVPRTFPAFPRRDDISVYATLRPARELGGDFYDFFFVDADHLFFCVGDVSDKGVPAALFMAAARTLIRARGADDPSPASLVTYVNAELARDNDACMFVTLFAGRLDTTTGDLLYTNAGHDPPYVLRGVDGELERLEERHGPLAGAAPGVVYGESRRRLVPGDLLVAFTDGVTEARDASARLFSEERTAEAVRTGGVMSAVAVVDRLVSAVEAFTGLAEQADDITILALQFRPPSHVAGLAADLLPVETVVIHNRPPDLDAMEAVLDRLARRARLPSETMSQIRIVCDEVLTNVITHGFPDEAEHEIEVRVEMAGRRLVLTVSDDGIPFDPLTVPPPDTSQPLEQRPIGGLGIYLVRQLVDEVTYERRGHRNVLTLVKAVECRPPDLGAGPAANVTTPDPGTSGVRDTDGRGDAQMEIRTRRLGDVLIADMVGRLDSRTAGPASTELNQIAQEGGSKLVLNVQGLEYISSAGLRAILVAAKLVQVHGGAMKISGANAAVKQVMEVSGMSSLLRLYDTEKDALAAFA